MGRGINPATLAADSIDHHAPDGELKYWEEIQTASWATRETLRRLRDEYAEVER